MKKIIIISSFIISITVTALITVPRASALSGSDFNPGKIIDDGVFFNNSTMGVGQIQSFLDYKVPTCDRYHTGFTGGSGTVYSPPWTCLKEYMENPTTLENNIGRFNTDGTPFQVAGGLSAAQIIYNASQQYGINPQVLLVLLQKEQSLVTDTWPASFQYRAATGYGCPDTAACDSTYYGFYNQVTNAAKQFRRYANYPDQYNFKGGVTRYIQYSPSSSCGGSNIYIQNQATANLYNYTPYQPNPALLANIYGSGDSCSSYGNLNFWKYFMSWFGSTSAINGNVIQTQPLTLNTQTPTSASVGDEVTASYEVSNTADYDVQVGGLGVCARINNANYDFGFSDRNVIPAKGKITVTYTKKLTISGNLNIFICSYNDLVGGWSSGFYPYNTSNLQRSSNIQVQDNPLITTGLSTTPSNPSIDQPITTSFTISNSSNQPINIGSMVVAARDATGKNIDYEIVNDVIVNPNSSYTYSKTNTFTTPGKYSLFIANWNGSWNTTYPISANSSIVRNVNLQVLDNPLVSTSLSVSPSNPAVGQNSTATFTIVNSSSKTINIGSMVVAARSSANENVDFDIINDVTISPSSTYTYTKNRVFTTPGKYSLFIANWNGSWNTTYPISANSSIVRSTTIDVLNNPLMTTGLTISPNPSVGQPVSASFVLTNYSNQPINIGSMVVAARDATGKNIDYEIVNDVIVNPNSSYTYSKTNTFTTPGKYSLFIANWNGSWNTTYPISANSSIVRSTILDIK